ncbi:MAG: EscN/YscN/HrcN family type III secretion system ATPase, partial [Halobacteriovoraceae bacterium]|nr:EscN/YscN/HrcN family type III secretion system ATPase [Halobacteriovoraceae bacterium]
QGLKKSVIVVATSDTSALIRIKAAYTATTIAEYFRDNNKDVLFMMDSITRFAMAGREVALSVGESPGRRGYPPSVFAKLPKLMERVGTRKDKGTITGIYTVLVEGGDMDEPISDSIRAISDGHIVLDRNLAARNHFPAIDILDSISRVMNKVVSNEHLVLASYIKDLYAAYKEKEDLIAVGAYGGGNEKVDKSIRIHEELNNLLKQMQGFTEFISIEDIYDRMVELTRKIEQEFASSEDSKK